MPWMVREFTAWKLHTKESKDVLSLIYEGTAESFPAFLEKRLQERKEEAVFNNGKPEGGTRQARQNMATA